MERLNPSAPGVKGSRAKNIANSHQGQTSVVSPTAGLKTDEASRETLNEGILGTRDLLYASLSSFLSLSFAHAFSFLLFSPLSFLCMFEPCFALSC